MIKIISGGLSTTVQDLGRPGQYAIGMPPSGAMDNWSLRIGNLLVGNPEDAAALEATYLGPTVEFTDDRLIAVTGGTAEITINGEPITSWRSYRVTVGDILSFGMIKTGCRPYLAISGGIDVPLYLGSRSTYTLIGLGGFEGRKLADDDQVPLGEQRAGVPNPGELPTELIPEYLGPYRVRMVVGLASYRITEGSLAEFFAQPWKITKDADRVGYRLRGGTLDFVPREQPFGAGSDPANVVDLGYPIGSVQVPGGDEPIVLLGDAVTGGGYATIGTVISVDRDIFGQARTGDTIDFEAVDIDTALQARAIRAEQLTQARQALSGGLSDPDQTT